MFKFNLLLVGINAMTTAYAVHRGDVSTAAIGVIVMGICSTGAYLSYKRESILKEFDKYVNQREKSKIHPEDLYPR